MNQIFPWRRLVSLGHPWTLGEIQKALRWKRDGHEIGWIAATLNRTEYQVRTVVG